MLNLYAYEQWIAERARLGLGREEAIEYRRESDLQNDEEIARLMAERASFAESARKRQSDGSSRVKSERSNVAKNLTAIAGCVKLMVLKLLTGGSRD